MPLTDAAIRNAKPGKKLIKLSDGGGLHLLIQPHGREQTAARSIFSAKIKPFSRSAPPKSLCET